MSALAAAERRYCTFLLGPYLLGIHISRVQEVLRHQVSTPVPLAHRTVAGLINLRGQIVTAIDLRRRLELSDQGRPAQPMNVVLRLADGHQVSLLVDEIGDVIEADDLEAPPDTLPACIRGFLSGIHKLRDRLLLVIDADQVAAATAAPTQPEGRS